MRAFIDRRVKQVLVTTVMAASAMACGDADRDVGVAPPIKQPAPSVASRSALVRDGLVSPDWQATLTALVAQNHVNPLAAGRAYALLGVAQYRAVQLAEREGHGDADHSSDDARSDRAERGNRASDHGAVAGASAVVLSYLFPLQQQAFEDLVTAQRDASPGRSQRSFSRGEAIGRTEGARIVARAKGDGFDKSFTGTIPVGPGFWFSNTAPATVGGGQMPEVLPWFLTSARQFRPAPPPAFGSPAYLAALAEIRHISDTRTNEQIRIATFWAMNAAAINPGEPTPPGYWVGVGTDDINQHSFSEREATHLYALLSATMFDAAIGCWDGKLTYWMIRPWQADPMITLVPAVGKPNHPSYPSAHSCFSASGAEVLSAFFPAQRARLDSLVAEAGLSRMYGGIHYRFDIEAGTQLGRNVAQFAITADKSGRSVLTSDDDRSGEGARRR
jgi:membrane-associated phospholipid phosphatase